MLRDKDARPARVRLPGWLIHNAAHLSALWGLAVLQPTLEVLGDNADLFVARQVAGWALVIVLVGFALVPPLVLAGLEGIAQLIGQRLRVAVHIFFIWALLALFALYALEQVVTTESSLLIPVAWVVGAGTTVLYTRTQALPSLLAVLSVTPVVFVAYFIVLSPSHKLIFPEEANARAGVRSSTPVVMLLLDELPVSSLIDERGRIDARLFPNFAELARGATWYRNTTAAADFTEAAVPALLTGRRPRGREVPVLRDHPENLFTLFGSSHRLEVVEHSTWLCPPSLCPNETPTLARMSQVASALSVVYADVIAPKSLADRLPLIGSTWAESRAAKDPKREIDPDSPQPALARHGDAQFEHFLDSLEPRPDDTRRPTFQFLHSALPHVPWKHGASGRLYTGHFAGMAGLVGHARLGDAQTWTRDRTFASHGLQRHLLQVRYADLLLGRLLERLRTLGLYHRSLLVVTADHGASFVPGGSRRLVDRSNAGDVGLVPFFLKAPGQRRPRAVDAHLESTDLLPTVAELLRARISWRVDGRPRSRLPRAGRRRVRVHRSGVGIRTFPTSLLERHRRRSVRRKLSLFGSGTGLAGLYGFGPDRDLLGERVNDLRPGRGAGSVELDEHEEFLSVDPRSRFVPALVTGTVPDGVARVAIGVNGRVEGVAPTHEEGGATRFSVMIRERSLRAGRNRVEVLAASGRGPGRRLSLLKRG